MVIDKFRDKGRRTKYLSVFLKKLRKPFMAVAKSTPVFILGPQRSGTTMFMLSLNVHPDTEVYDESSCSNAMYKSRLRNLQVIEEILEKSKFPFVCFKPLTESHRVDELEERFDDAKIIWMYRHYADTANSALRRFPNAPSSTKKVIEFQADSVDELRKELSGFFVEGLSQSTFDHLKEFSGESLSDFDYACLRWWSRNRLFFEQNLESKNNTLLVRYEDLVTNTNDAFRYILEWLGMRYVEKVFRHVHADSIKKNRYPSMNPKVEQLCEVMLNRLKLYKCAF